ncbi:hypothetical protein Taro_049217 [Colocasia esculenta]|uniref:GH16 domain-containing protein n=1 Tax=Colocasia esculenta TaxID=4460 RepID=A0A843XAC5_COLES|nr:hypothetical protein [Colocasia esculenta]
MAGPQGRQTAGPAEAPRAAARDTGPAQGQPGDEGPAQHHGRVAGSAGRGKLEMASCGREGVISSQEVKASLEKKYGGIAPKKKPLISKDTGRAFFDSADWALWKQGAATRATLECLRPKLQPTPHQQLPPRRPACCYVGDDQLLTLSLDKASGSGFQSKNKYLFGKIDMQIKLIPGSSAGTVTAYYLSSQGPTHDKIDFEFLGNLPLHTTHQHVLAGEGQPGAAIQALVGTISTNGEREICHQNVVKVLELALKRQRPLLIVAEDVESDALATLILDKLHAGIKVLANILFTYYEKVA